jgi:hypothetical protein
MALNTLVTAYNNLEATTGQIILAHLFACQYRLVKSDFNNWDDPEPN